MTERAGTNWWDEAKPPDLSSNFHVSWARTAMTWRAVSRSEPPPMWTRLKASLEDPEIAELTDTEISKGSGGKLFLEFRQKLREAFPELRPVARYTSNTDDFGESVLPDNSRQSVMFATGSTLMEIDFDGDRQVDLDFVSTDAAEHEAILKFWSENTTKSMPRGRVHVVVQTPEGPEFRSIGVGAEKLVRANYTDAVLAGYDRIVRDLQAKEPAGRIAIMNGKPGTGKTYLVRGLLNDVRNAIMIVVPSNMVAELAQPGMMPGLINLHSDRQCPLVFIIEDADECLAPRMGDNISAVSTMLNMGDGLLGKILDVRIICTTNAKHTDLDEAITRPGRLSTEIEVGPLDAKKAAEVYKRLTGLDKEIGKKTLAEVYQLARDDGWVPATKPTSMGFQVPEASEVHLFVQGDKDDEVALQDFLRDNPDAEVVDGGPITAVHTKSKD